MFVPQPPGELREEEGNLWVGLGGQGVLTPFAPSPRLLPGVSRKRTRDPQRVIWMTEGIKHYQQGGPPPPSQDGGISSHSHP